MQVSTLENKPWSTRKRIATLFAVYFAFLMLDFTSSDELFPHFVYVIMKPYTSFWHWIVPWTGEHILHLPYKITVLPNGSGDTTYNYVLQLLWVVFALLISITWAFLDRKRPSYQQFAYWSRIVVRYYLAYILFVYGFVKVIKLQFPHPSLDRLIEPFGDSSPMGLAWTFIGYSSGYNVFIGGAEVLAGILLFFKRTTLVGSLVAMSVMANVAAMNIFYDIPVKIFSLNLLFMAIWIAWYDKDRLINFFFLNQPTTPSALVYPFQTKWKKVIQLSLKSLAIIFAFYATLWSNIKMSSEYGDLAPKPPLYGIYEVESYKKNGKETLPLTTDSSRWKRMVISYPGYMRIVMMNDSSTYVKISVDQKLKNITISPIGDDQSGRDIMKYTKPKNDKLLITGIYNNETVQIAMKRKDEKDFPLMNRGFHWINEYPNNR